MTARKANPTAREKIVTAALESGWTTRPGYRETADRSVAWAGDGPDGATVNVEFSVRGAIKYASVGNGRSIRRLAESGRLALVLAHIWDHRVVITLGKKFGDMTPQEKRAAMKRAADRMSAELNANADRIAAVLDQDLRTDEERDAEAERGYEQHYRPGVSDPSETSGPGTCSGCHTTAVTGVAVVAAAHQCSKGA